MIKVKFLKIGQAADRLNIPVPTLREWSNELEKLGVHVLERNNRNERIIYPEDYAIFNYINSQRKKHGRHKTLQIISYEIEKEFTCRKGSKQPRHLTANSQWNIDYTALDEIDISILLEGFSEEIGEVSKIIRESDEQPKDDIVKYLGKLYAKESALKEIKNKNDDFNDPFAFKINLFNKKKRDYKESLRAEKCQTCGGTGGNPGEDSIQCDKCEKGRVEVNTPLGRIAEKCRKCLGKGVYYANSCPDCSGRGVV
ncbi:hypothetical protein [Halobacillus litoralis]|uniref:hypothetical protein n=1 Tax=Halobacillus litoralis TaxID=45668 RepID=UPI001CD7A71D|nr:hypothetical protein [Halobacillus litoralis]MCA1022135.1 hypothetical protein [Halobacillus litoralis]